MNNHQRELDRQLADYTDKMEMGLEVDIESYHPSVQELISTVQLATKGCSIQMPGANTHTRLKNLASAAYIKEYKQKTSLHKSDTRNQLQRLLSSLKIQPVLQFSLIATIIIAVVFLLPEITDTGLTGASGLGQGSAPVLIAIFLVAVLVFWLINRKPK
jgi:hypothetical protein